jgi:tRNA threonylcarbamoyladenosine biosynthesis protein TsaE
MDPSTVFLVDASATAELGRQLAEQWLAEPVEQRPILLLKGHLGAGKTSLVQGIAQGLGIEEPVTSPSFALAQHYRGRHGNGHDTCLIHLDLYRLEQPADADELFEQEEEERVALGALMAVEWPERLSLRPVISWSVELHWAQWDDPAAGRTATLNSQLQD